MRFSHFIPTLFSLISISNASIIERSTKNPLPVTLIHQYPLPTWIENIAIRPNGNLLLTFLTAPELHSLNPSNPNTTTGDTLIARFPNATGLTGITETHPDTFVLISPNTNSTFSLWTVDFTTTTSSKPSPKISKLTDLPSAALANGITYHHPSNSVLIADSFLGLSWRVSLQTRKPSIYAQNLPSMQPNASIPNSIGINGIHITHNNRYLYWTNSAQSTLYRASINPLTGNIISGSNGKAKVEKVAQVGNFMDDFTIDERNGVAWVATNLGDTVLAIRIRDGKVLSVVGEVGNRTVNGGTACAFGRGKEDRSVLYVVSSGRVNGTIVEGGKVVGIDTKGFR